MRLQFSNPLHIHIARHLNEVADVLRAAQAATARGHWAVGFVSYEAAGAFDAAFVTAPADAATPLAWFAEFAATDTAPSTDANPSFNTSSFSTTAWQSDTDSATFAQAVETIHADIAEGNFYQVNFTTRLRAEFEGDALAFYRALQRAQPNGYQMFIDTAEFKVLSVSPELFFSVDNGIITTQPMKGTAPRGDNITQDTDLAEALTQSPKERAENIMIVDLLRNDLSRIAKPHSVKVTSLCALTALPSVWQMTSTVQATLADNTTVVDVFAALFPCGSITGAPKIAATKVINTLEKSARGIYCGAIGYLAPDVGAKSIACPTLEAKSTACFNVGIRSVWIANGQALCGVGSGITYDAKADSEAAELAYKARFLMRAAKPFGLFETMRLEAGVLHRLEAHLDRLENSARHFRFSTSTAHLRDQALAAMQQLQTQYPNGIWRAKLALNADGTITATAVALDDMPADPQITIAATSVSRHDEFLQHKTTRRETYDAHTPLPNSGIWDTLLWNAENELTEFIRANLAIEINGECFTPPRQCGGLNGIMRAQWLAQGKATERILYRNDLYRAQKIWWLNSLRGAVAVTLHSSQAVDFRQ